MYMHEQRMKAVELFIESGFSENAVCRELGYPSGTKLRRWILKIQPESIQMRKEICIPVEEETCTPTGERVKWTWEQRSALVEDMRINKTPMYQVAAECDVSKAAIYAWKRKLLGKDDSMPMKRTKDTPTRPPADAPLEETVKTLELQVSEPEERIFYLQLELDASDAVEKLREKEKGISLTTLTNGTSMRMHPTGSG